jgi:SAM-dependent methyltransferase
MCALDAAAVKVNAAALRCPYDGDLLQWQRESLVCRLAAHIWPVRGGIPRFVESQGYAGAFGFQWARHAQTQLDSHNGLSLSRDRWFAVTGWPKRMNGERMLEAGSGPGRFTEVAAATGADVVSFDYSTAIDQNYANNRRFANVTFAQADLLRPPAARGSFDRVFCMGVLQHLPNPDDGFASLASLVAPGGWLVVDCYQLTAIALLHWKYILRPLTRRMPPDRLYALIERGVPPLLPVWKALRRLGGRYATRVLPIVSYSQLGIPDELNRAWSILDTFDMYAPRYDNPRSLASVRRWYRRHGFVDIQVSYGPNGIIGRGRKPALGVFADPAGAL